MAGPTASVAMVAGSTCAFPPTRASPPQPSVANCQAQGPELQPQLRAAQGLGLGPSRRALWRGGRSLGGSQAQVEVLGPHCPTLQLLVGLRKSGESTSTRPGPPSAGPRGNRHRPPSQAQRHVQPHVTKWGRLSSRLLSEEGTASDSKKTTAATWPCDTRAPPQPGWGLPEDRSPSTCR